MINSEIKINDTKSLKIVTNEKETNIVIIYFHGLDGTPNFSKPLFNNFVEFKIVAPEQRGHSGSSIASSRSVKRHIEDYLDIINYYKNKGKKVFVFGESMGAAYSMLIAYKYPKIADGFFLWSIPNKLVNVMQASKWVQFKVQFMTVLSFFTNINYKYTASVNYEKFSSSFLLHRVARLADKTKKRQVRETLATWSANKAAWRKMKKGELENNVFYFVGSEDVLNSMKKLEKVKNKKSELLSINIIEGGKHILMYESQFEEVTKLIKENIYSLSRK